LQQQANRKRNGGRSGDENDGGRFDEQLAYPGLVTTAMVPVGSGIIPEKSPAKSDVSPVTGIQLPIITTGCARSPSQSLGEDAQAETA
jgi:hypothetical protein